MSTIFRRKFNNLVLLISGNATFTLAFSPTHKSHLFSSSSVSLKSIEKPLKSSLFTVGYLINYCGFTPEKAHSVSKYVKLKVADKPNAVLAFFKDHGLTQTQISNVVKIVPYVLLSEPNKTFLPKIEFLKSKGYSDSDITMILACCPKILLRSLEHQLIPTFNSFSYLLQSDERTSISAFKSKFGVLLFDLEKHVANVSLLKNLGIPITNIRYLLAKHPRVFMTTCDNFRQSVDEVKRMDFDPLKNNFVIAIQVLRSMAKSTWESKVETYKKWGWSENEIIAAFRRNPMCMSTSEEKITSVMEFWVNRMGWESSFLATRPTIISYSLEKRVVPRCKVYKALLLKGFEKPCGLNLWSLLMINESNFIEKITHLHEKEAPELLKLYNERLNLADK